MEKNKKDSISRRDFLATGAMATAAISGFPFVHTTHAQDTKPIKVGLVGCGGRGTGAAGDALNADPNVRLVAMADPFQDRIDRSLKTLTDPKRRGGPLKGIEVTKDTCFSGMDGYKKVLEMDIDYVCLVSPPGFRPMQFEDAINAGKHVFAEKPLATDPVGVRKIRKTAQKAKDKGLSVIVGLNNRHSVSNEEIVKRIHDGAIGKMLAGRGYRVHGGLWHRGDERPKWTEMEYQCRNWYYFCWLSGDQITEMAIHTMDYTNRIIGSTPISALATGGRQVRTDLKYGNIFDHMTIDYEYPDDVHVMLMVRQWDNCDGASGSFFVGSEGALGRGGITGKNPWQPKREARGTGMGATVYEHWKLIDSIRNEKAINNALDFGADSTLTTIMGRESAYTGKKLTWDEMLNSDLDLFPKGEIKFGPAPQRPVAMPGSPRPL
ncbi:Gfo/Idh/MocA family protein [candidate division KSB1 bacterium]